MFSLRQVITARLERHPLGCGALAAVTGLLCSLFFFAVAWVPLGRGLKEAARSKSFAEYVGLVALFLLTILVPHVVTVATYRRLLREPKGGLDAETRCQTAWGLDVRARLHWFWRTVIAIAIGGALTILVAAAMYFVFDKYGISEDWCALVLAVPGPFTVAIYALLARHFGPRVWDGQTRCRKCNYILCGISEPRCPECGETI